MCSFTRIDTNTLRLLDSMPRWPTVAVRSLNFPSCYRLTRVRSHMTLTRQIQSISLNIITSHVTHASH